MAGLDLAKVVSVERALRVDRRRTGRSAAATARSTAPTLHVVAYDFGVKFNILRMLAERGCRITVVPAQTPAAEVAGAAARRRLPRQRPRRSRSPATTRSPPRASASTRGVPTFGICLGHQIMALACGATHLQDEVRTPRRQPPGEGSRQRPGQHHQPEPRLRGRPEDAAGDAAGRRTCRCSTARCRAWRTSTSRRSASRATRRPRPGRTTSATCSTASSR